MELKESSLSRLVGKIKERDCGTITAFRNEYSLKINKDRNAILKAKLLSSGFGVTSVDGVYIEDYGTPNAVEVKENVFFVEDRLNKKTLERKLIELGEEFEQDSVLFIPKGGKTSRLIGTKDSPEVYVAYKDFKEFPVLKLGKDDNEFLTRVKGRPLYLIESSVGETLYVGTNNGRYSQVLLAKKLEEQLVQIKESSISRIIQHIQSSRTFAVISAYRGFKTGNGWELKYPELLKMGEDERKVKVAQLDNEAHSKLRNELWKELRLGAIEQLSGYANVQEKSFFVPLISYENAFELSNKYYQQSMIWKDDDFFGIVYTINFIDNDGIPHKDHERGDSFMRDRDGDTDMISTNPDDLQYAFSQLMKAHSNHKKAIQFRMKENTFHICEGIIAGDTWQNMAMVSKYGSRFRDIKSGALFFENHRTHEVREYEEVEGDMQNKYRLKEAETGLTNITLEGVISALKNTNLVKYFGITDISMSDYSVVFNVISTKLNNLTLGTFEIYTNGNVDFMLYTKAVGGVYTLSKIDVKAQLSAISRLTDLASDYETNLKSLMLYLMQ